MLTSLAFCFTAIKHFGFLIDFFDVLIQYKERHPGNYEDLKKSTNILGGF